MHSDFCKTRYNVFQFLCSDSKIRFLGRCSPPPSRSLRGGKRSSRRSRSCASRIASRLLLNHPPGLPDVPQICAELIASTQPSILARLSVRFQPRCLQPASTYPVNSSQLRVSPSIRPPQTAPLLSLGSLSPAMLPDADHPTGRSV